MVSLADVEPWTDWFLLEVSSGIPYRPIFPKTRCLGTVGKSTTQKHSTYTYFYILISIKSQVISSYRPSDLIE